MEEDRGLVRSYMVKVRVRARQLARWKQAAERSGQTLSGWMRSILDRASRM